MIPPTNDHGTLPIGQHRCDWAELVSCFGQGGRRQKLLEGLNAGLKILRQAGCRTVYIDGSFVTTKLLPNDIDVVYEAGEPELIRLLELDPILLDFSNRRFQQKKKYGTEFFLADTPCNPQGDTFLNFFQKDRDGIPKGILILNLEELT